MFRASLDAHLTQLRRFITDESDRILAHVALVLALAAFFAWARRRARTWEASEGQAAPLGHLFDRPVAAALVVGLLSSFWIYSDSRALPGFC